MKLAHSRKPLKLFSARALCVAFLVILLTACGTNSTAGTASKPLPGGSTTKTATSVPATETTTSVPATNTLKPNAANLNIPQGSLLIQSKDGFQCPYHTVLGTVTDQLVFTSDPTTYSQAEIAQIRAYYAQSNAFTFSDAGTPSPPPTLSWVLGGSMDEIPTSITGPGGSKCGVVLTVTNTGNTPIQIPKVGVQLKADPQQNTYQYRLINSCSFLPPSQQGAIGLCPPTAGGGGNCNDYSATIQLGLGGTNTVFSAVPAVSPLFGNCGTLTLAPNAQDQLTIDFSLAPNAPGNLTYSIVPVFTLDTTQGEQTLTLSQLASTLAFAGANQFSCYSLQGTTFVLAQTSASSSAWCI